MSRPIVNSKIDKILTIWTSAPPSKSSDSSKSCKLIVCGEVLLVIAGYLAISKIVIVDSGLCQKDSLMKQQLHYGRKIRFDAASTGGIRCDYRRYARPYVKKLTSFDCAPTFYSDRTRSWDNEHYADCGYENQEIYSPIVNTIDLSEYDGAFIPTFKSNNMYYPLVRHNGVRKVVYDFIINRDHGAILLPLSILENLSDGETFDVGPHMVTIPQAMTDLAQKIKMADPPKPWKYIENAFNPDSFSG